MNYETTLTLDELELELIEWAESEGSEDCPECLRHWTFDEEQLEILKEACAITHAAASIANAMWCFADEEGVATIAQVLTGR
jgi:hypothetical protein